MAERSQEEKDKAMERATSIVGDMPTTDTYKSERAKWDAKGNLIDEEEVAKEQRFRAIALGKVKPEREDFATEQLADKFMDRAATAPMGTEEGSAPVGPASFAAGELAPENNPHVDTIPPQVDPAFVPPTDETPETPTTPETDDQAGEKKPFFRS